MGHPMVRPDMMLTDVNFGGKDLRTADAKPSMDGALVSFGLPRAGLAVRYLDAL
jgi:hypothetical protein